MSLCCFGVWSCVHAHNAKARVVVGTSTHMSETLQTCAVPSRKHTAAQLPRLHSSCRYICQAWHCQLVRSCGCGYLMMILVTGSDGVEATMDPGGCHRIQWRRWWCFAARHADDLAKTKGGTSLCVRHVLHCTAASRNAHALMGWASATADTGTCPIMIQFCTGKLYQPPIVYLVMVGSLLELQCT